MLLARDYTAPWPYLAAVAVVGSEAGSAALRYAPRGDSVELRDATSTSALVTEEAFGDPLGGPRTVTTTVVALDGSRPPVSFPGEPLADFTLLDPSLLYRTTEAKFYRLAPPLARTALPAPLAGSAAPGGSYHAVRLR